jgi:formate hydrogenlyase subunit 6/NADH:ubiquinone oxidoreductase subunit I
MWKHTCYTHVIHVFKNIDKKIRFNFLSSKCTFCYVVCPSWHCIFSVSKEKKDGVLKNDMENLRHERCIVNIKMLYLEI